MKKSLVWGAISILLIISLTACSSLWKTEQTTALTKSDKQSKEETEKTGETAPSEELQIVLNIIKEKYPFYLGYSIEKGLSILVYKMANDEYRFSLTEDKTDPTDPHPWAYGVCLTAEEIKALLVYYDLKDEDIILHYCPLVISNDIGVRTVDREVQALFDYKYSVGKAVDKESPWSINGPAF